MTTIAAVQGADFAVVAFDSLVSEAEEKIFYLPRSLPKVVRKDNCILGAAGDLRAVNLISTFDLPTPSQELRGGKLDVWVGRTFVPKLKDLFEESGYEKDDEHGSTIILVVNCTIYEIGTSYEWLRDERGFYTTGTGGFYAAGFLLGAGPDIHTNLESARTAALRSVEIAAALDPLTGGDVHFEELLLPS